ncbi:MULTISPECIES: DUF4145 domain-containing protein [unclassified Mycobacterium]|uniref:DUF4145 domain-containing protein n=1 Tax=unclassified Mycobacterium TaxID=2642494 RepID=UPI00048E26D2|nr:MULTISPECIES: DUF4145 domain-containing protein [unclassified Mycobacterium]
MDWLTFVSGIIEHLAWPGVVVGGGLVFRKQLTGVFERLKALLDDRVEEASLTRQGFSVRRRIVDAGLENAKKELTEEPESAEPITGVVEEEQSPFLREMDELARLNPAASVGAAAARLEVALRSVLAKKNPAARQMTLGRLIKEAAAQGVLTEGEASAARYLVQVRNEAVHENVASENQAMEFAYLALRVAAAARLAVGEVSVDGADPL